MRRRLTTVVVGLTATLLGVLPAAAQGAIPSGGADEPASAPMQPGPTQATSSDIVDVPVSFEVQNTNNTPVQCGPFIPDGETYTIRGTLTGPADAIERGDSATLYLHAVTQGEFYWRFDAVPGYNFVQQQAERGNVSVTIDRLGYGESDRPPGLESCFGSQADTSNQVLRALKSGDYEIESGEPATFEKVFVAGHSAGGLTATILSYAFPDSEGLINFGWADQSSSEFTVTQLTETNQRCTMEALTGGDSYTPFGNDKEGILFFSATPEVRAAVPEPQDDPCGDLLTFGNGIAANLIGVAQTTDPVLIVAGANDKLFPPPALEIQAFRYFNSSDVTYELLANTGHGFNYEITRMQSVDLVDRWLTAHGG